MTGKIENTPKGMGPASHPTREDVGQAQGGQNAGRASVNEGPEGETPMSKSLAKTAEVASTIFPS